MRLFPIFFLISFLCFGQQNNSNDQKRDSIIDKGLSFYNNRDLNGLENSAKKLLLIHQKKSDSFALAKAYHFEALIFRIQYRLDSSYYYYHKSKAISERIGDSLEVGKRLLSMCYMQKDEKDYVGAEVTIVQGLRFLEPLNENRFTGHSLNALGNVLIEVNRFNEAREYYDKALALYKNIKRKIRRERNILEILNNKGNSYLLEGKPRKALGYFTEALEYDSIKENHFNVYKRLFVNAAECKYLLGDKEEAWKDFIKLMKIRQKEEDEFGLSLSHNGFAHYYQLERKNKEALYHAKKGYELSKKVNNNLTRLSALIKLANLTSGVESKKYFNEYVSLNDSLNKRERFRKIQYAKIHYETEKKEKENTNLKLDNSQKQAQIEQERQQKLIGWLASGLAILGLGFSYVYFRARRKKLMYEAQLQKASVREEERQQIAKSLHDEVAGDLRMLHQKLSKTELQKEADNLEKIKENVRNLSHQLSSVSFDEVSFKDQIVNLIADSFSPSFRISTEGINDVGWKEINNTLKRTLYLCIRESLQNTLKYAEASKFFIHFSIEKKEIVLLLKDNGKGFDLTKGKKGIGLKNLKERVEEIHGSFDIESSEEGTKTTIRIPIHGR